MTTIGGRIITEQNDTADKICQRHYGDTTMTEKLLAANHGLADYGPVLPMGITVDLPAPEPAPATNTIKLWD